MRKFDNLFFLLVFGVAGYAVEGDKALAGIIAGSLAVLYLIVMFIQKYRLMAANLNYEAQEHLETSTRLNKLSCKNRKLKWMLNYKFKHPKKTREQVKKAWKKRYHKKFQL